MIQAFPAGSWVTPSCTLRMEIPFKKPPTKNSKAGIVIIYVHCHILHKCTEKKGASLATFFLNCCGLQLWLARLDQLGIAAAPWQRKVHEVKVVACKWKCKVQMSLVLSWMVLLLILGLILIRSYSDVHSYSYYSTSLL